MHPQLEILLQIQDLKAQRRELIQGEDAIEVQREEFGLNIERAVEQLDEKITGLEEELESPIRGRYDRLASGVDRVVVPAINGTCYGCFVAVPTAVASDPDERMSLNNCAHCGRFLYFTR
jgi:predicted  nucleic acid-binding Zn-ribbon protein